MQIKNAFFCREITHELTRVTVVNKMSTSLDSAFFSVQPRSVYSALQDRKKLDEKALWLR